MIAETLNFLAGLFCEETQKLVLNWDEEPCERPAIPDILPGCGDRGSRRGLARRSETNEVEEAESSKARAFIVKPLGDVRTTWQVMSNELDFNPVAARAWTGIEVFSVDVGVTGASKCSKE